MRNSKTMSSTTLLCHGRILKRIVGAFKRYSQISSNSVLEMQKGCVTHHFIRGAKNYLNLNLGDDILKYMYHWVIQISNETLLHRNHDFSQAFLDLFKVLTSKGKSVGTSKLIHFFSLLRRRHFIYVFVYVPEGKKKFIHSFLGFFQVS